MIVTLDDINGAIALLGVAADFLINRDEQFPRIAAHRHIYGERAHTGAVWLLAAGACTEVALRDPRMARTDIELLQAAHDLEEGRLPPGFLGIDFGEDGDS